MDFVSLNLVNVLLCLPTSRDLSHLHVQVTLAEISGHGSQEQKVVVTKKTGILCFSSLFSWEWERVLAWVGFRLVTRALCREVEMRRCLTVILIFDNSVSVF